MEVAIIGIGRWGQILLKELKLQAKVKYECDSKSDLNQVWNDSLVEVVFIATPTETHSEYVFFKTLPKDMIPAQKEFLWNNLNLQ